MGFHAFGDFTMTRTRFDALLPHERTEFALLLLERMRETSDERPIDGDIGRYAGMRHHYQMPSGGIEPHVNEGVAERIVDEASRKGPWPRTAAGILLMIDSVGGVLLSRKDEFAEHFAVSRNAIERAIDNLLDDKLISRSGGINSWALTERGWNVVASLKEQERAA
ncbi:Hypothetical protein NGAL_HAMBI1146_58500 [Neorhizobium galegae bv. officinalis]|nr:Hypothetical protein NGAL_HAMBI1146_58500 [Neorhizobium galegae bv. officinalis]